jgi:hypothetical protein
VGLQILAGSTPASPRVISKTEEGSLAGIVSLDNLSPQLLQNGAECRRDYIYNMSPSLRITCRLLIGNWRMPAGVHGHAGFDTRPGSKSRGTLAPFVASMSGPAANAGGTTFNLQVSGSNPGRAFTGTVAQWDRAAETFLHRLSPQVWLDFDCWRRMPKGLHGFPVQIRAVSREHPEQ